MEAFELVLPEEFLRLQGNIFELIKESTAVLRDAREIVLEIRDFQKLKNFLKKKKVRGLAIKSKWFDIGGQNFRAVVYPRGNSETRTHLSFFIEKQKSVDSFDSTSYLLYTLSIERNGGNLTKVSNGRFHDEVECGWVDFVDLGLLLERDSAYLIDSIAVRFHARVNILDEWFCKGKVAAKSHGFEIGEPMKQEPFVWHVSNLSEILALTNIIVSPSFRLGKFPLNMVVFEKDGFVRGRLFSTVSDFDESWEIVYSFFVSVRGEVTIRDSRATLRPKSSENRDVRFFETTEIQQGCEVVLTCLLLSLTKLGENDHEAGVSRDIDLSPEQPLRSSSSSLNLPDSSSEPGVSSRIASLEAASLQIIAMQDMLHQIMNMQKEMQKQMITAQDNENIRLEIAVGKSMEKSLEANTDALWTLLQEENAKQEKLAREWTQQMISLISNCLNNLPALVEKAVKKEFSTVGSSVARMISPAIEKAVSVAIPEAFQKWVGDKAVNQLEKSVNLKIEATVARQIQAQFQTSGKRALQETLKSSLEASVIPAFEISCKAMFEQVATTFQKGMIHPATEAQQQFESALRDAINSTSSLTQTLSGELADGQRKLLALAAAGANSKAVNPLVTQLGNGPLGGLHDKIEAPLDLTKELSRLVSEHKYEEAFTAALQRSDVSIVSWLCSQVDLQWILATVPLPLSQGVLLSLLQQLACDISKNTTRKLVWMTEVAIALNPTDPMIAVHVQPIFEQVYQILNHHRSLPTASSTELSLIRLLMHVINSMVMSEFISKFRSFLVFVDRWEKI